MSERLDKVAALYDEVAAELERAAAHAGVAAQHFRDENVPRGSAHAWAVHGHLLKRRRAWHGEQPCGRGGDV